MSSRNRKMHQDDPASQGYSKLRVFVRKRKGKYAERLLVKCGCCNEKVEIYPADDEIDSIEINGVLASREEWRMLLLPMLSDKNNPIAILRKGDWKEYK